MCPRLREGLATSQDRAFLLGRAEYREADLIVTLFTETSGVVSALARSARRSRRRFGGALEPLHTLEVELAGARRGELAVLSSATIVRPRFGLLQEVARLHAAGRALGWVRHCVAPRTPEVALWGALSSSLDRLEEAATAEVHGAVLATFGFILLAELGWGLEFHRCVRCGRECPAQRPSAVSPSAGGVVCSACGGARTLISARTRQRLVLLAQGDSSPDLDHAEMQIAITLVEETLRAHAGFEGAHRSSAPSTGHD